MKTFLLALAAVAAIMCLGLFLGLAGSAVIPRALSVLLSGGRLL